MSTQNNHILTNSYVQSHLSNAIEKIEITLQNKNETESLELVKAYLAYAKAYSNSNNEIPALRSKGLEESLAIASSILDNTDKFFKELRVDLKGMSASILR